MYLFLILTVLSALPALITAPPGPSVYDVINDSRRNFAKRFNVANMNELEDDEALGAYADHLMASCRDKEELISNKSYQVIPFLLAQSRAGIHNIETYRAAEAYLNNPGQQIIGYSVSTLVPLCEKFQKDYNTIFVMGPLKKFVVKHGPPGSLCDADRVNKDGLCVKKQ